MDMRISAEVLNAEAFVDWLNERGHNAATHPHTGNFIDGTWVATDAALDAMLAGLYQEFRNDSR